MLPESINIKHFRGIRDCSVSFSDNTVLVGPNGAGKSSIMHALRYFFDPQTGASSDAQFGSADDVVVTVSLGSLDAQELIDYADWLIDGKLVVSKKSSGDGVFSYVVTGKRFPGFSELRALENGPATPFNNAYRAFTLEHPEIRIIEKPKSAPEGKAELKRWELENPDRLEMQEVPFKFLAASKGQLIASTRLVYVPAVEHAESEFATGRPRTPLSDMINALVIPAVEDKPELLALRERWRSEYQELFPAGTPGELTELSGLLSNALSSLVPSAAVSLRWGDYIPQAPVPSIDPLVLEDGVPTPIEMQGNGFQRAMIIALLQAHDEQLRAPRDEEGAAIRQTHVLLLIEEPELYQHPPRARHFRRVLKTLALTPTAKSRFQVLSTTHSPDLVSLDDLESIRIVRKQTNAAGGVPIRKITSVTAKQIIEAHTEALNQKPLPEASLQKNLHVLDGALREAFFASAIVLTEGVSDVGILSAVATHCGVDFESRGIVVTSVFGKGQLPIASTILRLLDIKNYIIFDADKPDQLADNQRLLRLLGVARDRIPAQGSVQTMITGTFAVLNPKIETIAQSEFGIEAFKAAVAEASVFFEKEGDVMKNPAIASSVITALLDQGLSSPTLSKIVESISALS